MLLRTIARPLLASAFIASGAQLVRAKPEVSGTVQPMVDASRDALPDSVADKVPDNATTVLRAAGAVQIAGGLLLATGRVPRVASGVLAASLVPVTVYDGAFWTETDPVRREARKVGLVKNAGLLGGVLLAAADTEGKPSIAWRARHAVKEAQFAGEVAAREASLAGKVGRRAAKRVARRAAKETLRSHGGPVAALAVPLALRAGSEAVAHLDGHAHDDLAEFGDRAAALADKAKGKAEIAAVKAKANAPVVAAKARNRADEAAAKVADRAPLVVDEAKLKADKLAEKVSATAPIVAERTLQGAELAKDKVAGLTAAVGERAPEVAEDAKVLAAEAGRKAKRSVRKAQKKAQKKAEELAARNA